ncbi:hypothetical protein B7463_g9117, partial [Scytalidium lignicola]
MRKCFNPFDKVFGMYGILQYQNELPLPAPDYGKDFATVWIEFFRYILSVSRSLVFLQNPGYHISPVLSETNTEHQALAAARIPSWVLSFIATQAKARQWQRHHCLDEWLYRRGPCRIPLPSTAEELCDKRKLTVIGKRLGEVSSISPWSGYDDIWMGTQKRAVAFFNAWRAFSGPSDTHDDPDPLDSLLRRINPWGSLTSKILAADEFSDGDRDTQDYDLHYWNRMIQAGKFKGLGPDDCQVGDIVVILDGASTRMVLRPVENGEFILAGHAMCAGVKWWEDWNCFNTGEISNSETFSLV